MAHIPVDDQTGAFHDMRNMSEKHRSADVYQDTFIISTGCSRVFSNGWYWNFTLPKFMVLRSMHLTDMFHAER